MPTPTSLLLDVLAKSCFSLFELTDSRLELIIVQAMRKTPIPAMRDKTAVAIWTGVINKLYFARLCVRVGFSRTAFAAPSYNPIIVYVNYKEKSDDCKTECSTCFIIRQNAHKTRYVLCAYATRFVYKHIKNEAKFAALRLFLGKNAKIKHDSCNESCREEVDFPKFVYNKKIPTQVVLDWWNGLKSSSSCKLPVKSFSSKMPR